MPSDIRSFFGGKPSQPASEAVKPAKKEVCSGPLVEIREMASNFGFVYSEEITDIFLKCEGPISREKETYDNLFHCYLFGPNLIIIQAVER